MNALPEWIEYVLVHDHGFVTRADNLPERRGANTSRYRAERRLDPFSFVANVLDRPGGGYRITMSVLLDSGPADPRVLTADFDTRAELDQRVRHLLDGAQQVLDNHGA